MLGHERQAREQSPSAGGGQSIKAPNPKTRGYDAGKKVVGRKRHIAVDTDGRLLMVNLSAADISDSAGAQVFSMASASAGLGSNTSSQTEPITASS